MVITKAQRRPGRLRKHPAIQAPGQSIVTADPSTFIAPVDIIPIQVRIEAIYIPVRLAIEAPPTI